MLINNFSIFVASLTLFLTTILALTATEVLNIGTSKRIRDIDGTRKQNIFVLTYKRINKPIKDNLKSSGLNVKITPEKMMIIIVVCSITGFVIGLAINNIAVALMLGFVGLILPNYWLKTQATRGQNKITEVSSVCIHVLMTSFHFGVSIPNLKTATEQMNGVLKQHFEKIVAQLLSGQDIDEIYDDFCSKVENKYLRFAVKNTLVSITKGTDVVPILFSLMESVQNEKIRIAKINKAASEATLMSWVSMAIALFILVGYSVLSPQFLEVYLFNPIGKLAVTMLIAVMIFVMYTFEKIKQIKI